MKIGDRVSGGVISKERITKEGNRYYPEHYKEPYFFGLLGGYWARFKTDELCLNGYYTELITCDLSYSTLKMAKDYFKESVIEVIEL